MALVLSGGEALENYEIAFKEAWAKSNDDGSGIFWREIPQPKKGLGWHIKRVKDSKDTEKVPNPYDRMLIHFRVATGGDGTHPFFCACKVKDTNNEWILTHNGIVSDKEELFKKLKEMGHKFRTDIDSEILIHLWAETNKKDQTLLERVKAFTKKAKDFGVGGSINILLYNIKTDEWVALSDGSLDIVERKDKLIVVSSDYQWLDDEGMKAYGAKKVNLFAGDVVTGKGLDYKIKKDLWKIPTRYYGQCFVSDDYELGVGYYGQTYGRYQGDIWRKKDETNPKVNTTEKTNSDWRIITKGNTVYWLKTETANKYYPIPKGVIVEEAPDFLKLKWEDNAVAWIAKTSLDQDSKRKWEKGERLSALEVPYVDNPEMIERNQERNWCVCGHSSTIHALPSVNSTAGLICNMKACYCSDFKKAYSIKETENTDCECGHSRINHPHEICLDNQCPCRGFRDSSSPKKNEKSEADTSYVDSIIPDANCGCSYKTERICQYHWRRGLHYWGSDGRLYKLPDKESTNMIGVSS